jgi:hypothetical protein
MRAGGMGWNFTLFLFEKISSNLNSFKLKKANKVELFLEQLPRAYCI